MRLPSVLDATVRYLVLTGVGVVALLAVPVATATSAPRLLDRPGPTPANLVGIAVILAAWGYFTLVAVLLRGVRPDPVAIVALGVGLCSIVAFAAASASKVDAVGAALLVIATLAHLVVSTRSSTRPVPKEAADADASA